MWASCLQTNRGGSRNFQKGIMVGNGLESPTPALPYIWIYIILMKQIAASCNYNIYYDLFTKIGGACDLKKKKMFKIHANKKTYNEWRIFNVLMLNYCDFIHEWDEDFLYWMIRYIFKKSCLMSRVLWIPLSTSCKNITLLCLHYTQG